MTPAIIEMDYSSAANKHFAELCIQTCQKSRDGLSIVDAIVSTSINSGLDYHLGPDEYKMARRELVKLVCCERKPTRFDVDGNPTNGRPRGKYNHLLGKKIFPDLDKNRGRWAGNVKPKAEQSTYKAPDGKELPLIKKIVTLYDSLLELDGVVETNYNSDWWEQKMKEPRAARDRDLEIARLELKSKIRLGQDLNREKEDNSQLEQQVISLTAVIQRLGKSSAVTA